MGRRKAKEEDVVGQPAVKVEELPVLDVLAKVEAQPVAEVPHKTEDEKHPTVVKGSPSDMDADDALPMSDMARMLLAKHEEANPVSPEEAAAEKFYSLEYAKSGRSVCKGKCGRAIPQGAVRFGSSDTSNGYVMTMWRCVHCVTGRQLQNVQALYQSDSFGVIRGWEKLTEEERVDVTGAFNKAKAKGVQVAMKKEAARIAREEKKTIAEIRRNRRERFVSEAGDWFDWKTLLDDGELAAEQASFLRLVCDWVGVESSGTKAKLLQRLSDCKDSPPRADFKEEPELGEQSREKGDKKTRRDDDDALVRVACKKARTPPRCKDEVKPLKKPRRGKRERASMAEVTEDIAPTLRRSQRARTTRTLS